MGYEVEIVDNSEVYWDFIRGLRNDERVQAGFLQRAAITPSQQRDYMRQYESCFIVALLGHGAAGYAGSIDGDIRVCTTPDSWGRGVGKALVTELIERFPASVARVKNTNRASLALFKSCGFKQVRTEGELQVFQYPDPQGHEK